MDCEVPKGVGLTMASFSDVMHLDYYYVIRNGRAKLVIDIIFRRERESEGMRCFRGRRVPLSCEKSKYIYYFSHFKFARMSKKQCERGFCVTLESPTTKKIQSVVLNYMILSQWQNST